MAIATLPMIGGCRCGKVRFRVDAPPLLTMVCHCSGCQRMTASAFSTSIAVPTPSFAVTQGEAVIGGLHGDQARHHHCDWCKSWIFTEFGPDNSFVNARATMLDDPGDFVPFAEFWTSEKLPWAMTPATHSFATQPKMEAFPPLLAAFAAR
jgi:hypothetical protein